jgi:hypothetical protein
MAEVSAVEGLSSIADLLTHYRKAKAFSPAGEHLIWNI